LGQNRDSGGFPVRTVVPIASLLVLSFSIATARASSPDATQPDQGSIDALEAKVLQAEPRDQCFLYAELVHQMTELSVRQYAAGDVVKATGLLKQIQQFAQKIHFNLGDNDKRLKNSELLLSHAAFRLHEMLHVSSIEDRPLVEQTLSQVNQAQNATMMQVFSK
jgi:hypothetical protein